MYCSFKIWFWDSGQSLVLKQVIQLFFLESIKNHKFKQFSIIAYVDNS